MKRGIISVLTFLILAPAILNAQNKRQYYKAGNDFLENGNYQDAIAQYTKAVDISPDYVKAYLERANAYELMGNLEKAAEDYKRATIFMPKETDVFYHTGRLYNDLGRYLEALEMLNIALELKSSNMAALQEKIIALTAMEQYVDALEVCNRALFLKENELNLYLTGIVQEELNNLEEAENHFSKSISKEKEFTDSYISLADLQVRLDKSAEALENINKALDLEPKNTEALFVRSKVYVKLLDYAKAVNDISTNILIEPDKEKWYFVRGTYYQHFTQHQNAINDFNKVLSMNDKYAEGYYKRAESYEEIANFNAAIKDYEKLIDLSEFDGKARQLLKSANERLFELNRETVSPVITVLLPKENEEGSIEIPREEVKFSLKGIVQDESELKSLFVNGNPVQFLETENGHEFFTTVVLEGMDEFNLQAEDVYGNVADKTYSICRTEINAPDIKLLAPYASDNGEIYLDSSDPTLYVEGKISDESFIKSILIDGVAASYKLDELNPSFTATLNISNKRSFIVNVVDIYGNESEKKFVFNREGINLTRDNPMGKTWVIFIENSNYSSFASLEGPGKDVTLMRTALAKYKIHNIIHKKDLKKTEMERFFSIELRDLLRSNRVNALMIWYAGHGKFINETGYWIPIDAQRDDEFTYFNLNTLKSAMQSYSNTIRHMLVVTDACESGPTFYQAMRSMPETPDCGNWEATKFKSSQVFTSAGYELAVDNSQFTRTFANTLASNPDACIPIERIVSKVTIAVGRNNQQKPRFGKIAGLEDENGTFFFISKD